MRDIAYIYQSKKNLIENLQIKILSIVSNNVPYGQIKIKDDLPRIRKDNGAENGGLSAEEKWSNLIARERAPFP